VRDSVDVLNAPGQAYRCDKDKLYLEDSAAIWFQRQVFEYHNEPPATTMVPLLNITIP